MPAARLQAIVGVTYTVPDPGLIEDAYTRWLGYRVLARGEVTAAEAARWGAPALAGRASLTLAPARGTVVALRFVQEPQARGQALTSFGWNVSEIVVEDVDALATRLAGDSPFRIIGAPASLARFPMIRAMQVLGPANECLYFTQVGAGSGLDLARAEAWVGRVFIVVAGGPRVASLFDAYAPFANEVDPPCATPLRVLSAAHGLPPETPHRHGLVKLGNGSLVELDEYPASCAPRHVPPGSLPSGMAIVTFAVAGASALPPLRRGAGGELIDFVAASASSLQEGVAA